MKILGFGLIPNPWIFYFSGSFDENINHKILYQITLNFYQINILLKKKKTYLRIITRKRIFHEVENFQILIFSEILGILQV